MSETGSHLGREAAVSAEPGNDLAPATGSSSHGQNPDDRTVITNRPPIPVVGGGGPLAVGADLGRALLGEQLDHFLLKEYVGGGGMGVVFKALDTRLNRVVALKVLARDQADADEKVRRFQNEAQSAARLDHDHIARVYFVGQDRGLHYIVFEYIEGVNLRDLVARRGPLPLDEAISYTLQVAEALAHAASRDVVHRDIKPSNVLITPQGRAKLVDMGLARLHQVEADNDLTSSGVTLGTFDYISPEQARDPRNADVRSDIYSLGCTLYYMLTARPPFPDGNVLQKLLQHNNDPPPDPADYNPELPEQVSRLVRKMLAKDPRRRQQTAGELVADLLVLIDQLGLPTSNVDPLAWTVAARPRVTAIERHLPWAAPLAILIVVVAVLEFAWRSDEQPAELPGPRDSLEQSLRASEPGRGSSQRQVADIGTLPTIGRSESDAPSTLSSAGPIVEPASSASAASPASTADPASPPVEIAAPGPKSAVSVPEPPMVSENATSTGSTTTPPATPTRSETAGPPETKVESPLRSPTTMPPTPRLGTRIVNPYGAGPNEYASLRQACTEATNNDIIELQFNGRLEEKPFRVSNKTLVVRAAEGFSPTIAFRPREPVTSEPQAMLTVVGGQLTFLNVALEVDIPQRLDPPSWALFQMQRVESLRLNGCWLTIRNATPQRTAFHPGAAFFEIVAPPDTGVMTMEHTTIAERPLSLQLQNCIARGEATLLRCDDLQPLNMSWNNGLLATSERLLTAQGAEMASRTSGEIAVELRHVTAHVRNGLCLISNAEGSRPLLHTELQCTDSILLAAAESPLIEQTGVNSVDEFEEQVEWAGNRYYYSGFNTFWKISSFSMPQPAQDPVRRSFDEWQRYWNESLENQETWSRVVWRQLPDSSRPFHTHTPDDYALDDQSLDNQARLGATDGTDAGLNAADLPPPPEAMAEEEESLDAEAGESETQDE